MYWGGSNMIPHISHCNTITSDIATNRMKLYGLLVSAWTGIKRLLAVLQVLGSILCSCIRTLSVLFAIKKEELPLFLISCPFGELERPPCRICRPSKPGRERLKNLQSLATELLGVSPNDKHFANRLEQYLHLLLLTRKAAQAKLDAIKQYAVACTAELAEADANATKRSMYMAGLWFDPSCIEHDDHPVRSLHALIKLRLARVTTGTGTDLLTLERSRSDGGQLNPARRATSLYADIARDLGKKQKQDGCVYAYVHIPPDGDDSKPISVKIGETGPKKAMIRIREWKKQCKSEIYVLAYFETKYAKQVERLIHAELKIDSVQINMDSCQGCKRHQKHREWFMISRNRAKEVMEYWCGWANFHLPYESDGKFKSKFRDELLPDRPLTSFHHDSRDQPWFDPKQPTSSTRERDDNMDIDQELAGVQVVDQAPYPSTQRRCSAPVVRNRIGTLNPQRSVSEAVVRQIQPGVSALPRDQRYTPERADPRNPIIFAHRDSDGRQRPNTSAVQTTAIRQRSLNEYFASTSHRSTRQAEQITPELIADVNKAADNDSSNDDLAPITPTPSARLASLNVPRKRRPRINPVVQGAV